MRLDGLLWTGAWEGFYGPAQLEALPSWIPQGCVGRGCCVVLGPRYSWRLLVGSSRKQVSVVLLEKINSHQAFRDVSRFCFPQVAPPSTDPWNLAGSFSGVNDYGSGSQGDSITWSIMGGQASAGRMFWRMFTGGGPHGSSRKPVSLSFWRRSTSTRLLEMGGSVVQGA